MNIELRPAELADLEEIQNLFIETIHEICVADYNNDQLSAWASGIKNTSRWREKLINQYFLVAIAENKIIGFGSLENKDYIDFLYIHKDFQRKSIAVNLYLALEQEAKRLGTKHLQSDVSKTARGFFEKQEFKVITEQVKIIDSIEISNYRMVKELQGVL